MNLTTLPRGSFPEVGIREGLYQLHDGRPVVCSRSMPRNDIPPYMPPEKERAEGWQMRFYQVFGIDGRPQWLVLSAATGHRHLRAHLDLARSAMHRPFWMPGEPEDLC